MCSHRFLKERKLFHQVFEVCCCTYFLGQSGVSGHEGGGKANNSFSFPQNLDSLVFTLLFLKITILFFYFCILMLRERLVGQTPKKSKRIFWIPQIKFPCTHKEKNFNMFGKSRNCISLLSHHCISAFQSLYISLTKWFSSSWNKISKWWLKWENFVKGF